MRPTDPIDNLITNLKTTASPQLDDRIENLIAQSENSRGATLRPWSIFMKNPLTKFAAAAIVFIAVIVGITLIPGTHPPMTLASVIETLKNATCMSYDIQVGKDSPPIHDTVYGNIIRREVLGNTAMIDLEGKRILSLVEKEKQAVYIGFDGLPEMPKNYVNHIITLLTTLEDSDKVEVIHLGPKTVDGRELIGYQSGFGQVEVEIWMNPDTQLPDTIIERQPGLEVVCKNFDFDVEYQPELFSMDPPEGYAVMDAQGMLNFAKDGTEDNFIILLRSLAECFDGWFPQDVSVESYIKNATYIGHYIESKYEGQIKQMQVGMSMGKGLIFLRFYKGHGPWHYGGNGVKLGDAETPIFWYQPQDNGIYRVIFGDLHVEEVAADDIDVLVASRQAYMKYAYQIWDKQDIEGHQSDNWYLKKGNMIKVHSKIVIDRGPMFMPSVQIELPFDNTKLLSATLGDEAGLPYEKGDGRMYRFMPDGAMLADGENVINLIYEFSMDDLEKVDYGFKVPLQSVIPATSYELTATLEPDCGWVFQESSRDNVKDGKLKLFSIDGLVGSEFGTCGLPVDPK